MRLDETLPTWGISATAAPDFRSPSRHAKGRIFVIYASFGVTPKRQSRGVILF